MSLLFLLIQYLQSKIQWFVISILSKEIHLPSPLKVWHIPEATLLPSIPPFPFLSTPLEVQATSYLAASDSISSFLKISSLEHMFIINKLYTNICSDVKLLKVAAIYGAIPALKPMKVLREGNI